MSKTKPLYSESFKRFVRDTLERWRIRLYLHRWNIDLEFSPQPSSVDVGWVAATSSNHTYYRGLITIYPGFLEHPKDTWELSLVHELYHLVTAEYNTLFADILRGKLVTREQRMNAYEKMVEILATISLGLVGESDGKSRTVHPKSGKTQGIETLPAHGVKRAGEAQGNHCRPIGTGIKTGSAHNQEKTHVLVVPER